MNFPQSFNLHNIRSIDIIMAVIWVCDIYFGYTWHKKEQ